MKIELERELKITGEVWYRVNAGGDWKSFIGEDQKNEAEAYYELCKANYLSGKYGTEIIKSEEI